MGKLATGPGNLVSYDVKSEKIMINPKVRYIQTACFVFDPLNIEDNSGLE